MGSKRVGLARIEALLENLKRDIVFGLGTTFFAERKKKIFWTGDKTLIIANWGEFFFCDEEQQLSTWNYQPQQMLVQAGRLMLFLKTLVQQQHISTFRQIPH